MLNRIILMGNLGRDPEIQVTQDGRKIARISLATSSIWKDDTGEWQKRTHWHRIVVFKETTAGWIHVLKKGDPIYVEGSLTYHKYKAQKGNSYHLTYVVISNRDGRIKDLRSQERRGLASQHVSSAPEDTADFEDDPMEENDEEEESVEVPNKNFRTLH